MNKKEIVLRIIVILIVIAVLLLIIRAFTGTRRAYTQNKLQNQEAERSESNSLITERDLERLPDQIADYLRYVGVIGKPRLSMFEIEIDGEMRLDQKKDWAMIEAEQTTYLDNGTRLFYMVMDYNGLPINGLHHFEDGKASMVIKILDLVKVADNSGTKMDQAETVTYFNDMCLFAPAALLDANIVWEEIDDISIKGTFTNEGITVSAVLYFDEDHKLINFISNDRYALNSDGSLEQIPWSTPIEQYKDFHGYKLASKGEAIWHYDQGDFSYMKLVVEDINY